MKEIHKDIAKISFDIIKTTFFIKDEIAKSHSNLIENSSSPNNEIRLEDTQIVKSSKKQFIN
jgi:hypothetical protein